MTGNQSISLYFHIPFCKRKCDYCHFYVLPEQERAKDQLLEGFGLELALLEPLLKNQKVATLYFGGGTPSLFGSARIGRVIRHVKDMCDLSPTAEITLEANPESTTLEGMQGYAQAGINRVSIGIQTLDGDLLHLLGREHSPEMALQAIENTHRAGIPNLSIDLMYDLPKQTLSHWETTLMQIDPLPITHLSLYNLTIEPHTVFFKKQAHLRPLLPNEETSLAMYEKAIEILENKGLKQYEISAFATPGFESQHNCGYWIGRPFLGLGPSAFSYWKGKRFQNVPHLARYIKSLEEGKLPIDFQEELDPAAQLRELLVIRLRMLSGLSLDEFRDLDDTTQATIQELIEEGFLLKDEHRISLSKKGVLFYDTLAARLI